jgi:ornithine cyclodeaminase
MTGRISVYTDDDIAHVVTMEETINAIVSEVEEFMRDKRKGLVVSPPRFTCEASEGKLVVTAGASERKREIGLRVYSTYGQDTLEQQVTVLYNMDGEIKGIFVGENIGRLRTAAINAVAVKQLSRHDSRTLGVIGSGKQARSVVPAIARIRELEKIVVFSQHPSHAMAYSNEMAKELKELGLDISVSGDARNLVSHSDIVLTATTSSTPVLMQEWLKPGQHISSMGQKFRESHEIDPAIVRYANTVSSDSVQQLKSFGSLLFVDDATRGRITDLSELIDHGGRNDEDISLFLSVGLAGTEVVVAGRILSIIEKEENRAGRGTLMNLKK